MPGADRRVAGDACGHTGGVGSVELDLWQCRLTSFATVRFLQECSRSQVLVAKKEDTAVVCQSLPWVCEGLRVFSVQLLSRWSRVDGDVWTQELNGEQEMVLGRLAGLPCLEMLFVPDYLYLVGLDHVKGLTWVQEAWFVPEPIPKRIVRSKQFSLSLVARSFNGDDEGKEMQFN